MAVGLLLYVLFPGLTILLLRAVVEPLAFNPGLGGSERRHHLCHLFGLCFPGGRYAMYRQRRPSP